jgi:hypothetical protein
VGRVNRPSSGSGRRRIQPRSSIQPTARSWYLDEHGKNTVLWGGYTWQYWRATRSVKPAEYQFFGVGTGSRANRSAVTA